MTLDKAIETLKKMYEAALKMPFVFDPLAWALRGTWKLYLNLPDSTISMFQVQDAPDANAGDTVSKKAVELALLEKGQSSERYKIGEIWELNFDEIREALATVPSAQPEIIRCKNCRYWTRTHGDDRWGIGDCDVFDKHLVMCEGYCAWAERRTDANADA